MKESARLVRKYLDPEILTVFLSHPPNDLINLTLPPEDLPIVQAFIAARNKRELKEIIREGVKWAKQ